MNNVITEIKNTLEGINTRITETEEQISELEDKMVEIKYNGIPIRLTADLSAETLQARREWQEIFKVMKGKNLQPRLLYPARISFRFDGKIRSFTNKQKL